MDKFFKRTLVCAAVASVAAVGSANAAVELNGQALQLYGQAAGNLQINNPEAGENNTVVEIESRVGFRGTVEFDNFAPNFIYQIETGNAWNRGGNGDGMGAFGGRDTWLGLEFDGVGQLKIGRQLVAAYNYVDWPHSNPGLGNVFDWHNAIKAGYQDRANDVIRFDSATWNGFNFQATVSGMAETNEAMVFSAAASYTNSVFSAHIGHYMQGEYDVKEGEQLPGHGFIPSATCDKDTPADLQNPNCYGTTDYVAAKTTKAGDVSYTIIGGSLFLGDITLTAAYKNMQNDLTNNEQDAYSATAQYVINGQWVLKAGYAATGESKNGTNDDSRAITGRLGYLLPSTYLYMDVRSYDMLGDTDTYDATNVLIGAEYYF